jgi:hypothetical protein
MGPGRGISKVVRRSAAGPMRSQASTCAGRNTPVHPGPARSGRGATDHIATVCYPRRVPKDAACAKELKKRTLTNLYNQRPQWLALAHDKLDAAVFAAYGWKPALSDDELLAKLLALNLERSSAENP